MASVHDTVTLDEDAVARAHESMKVVLYAKLLGKAPPLDYLRGYLVRQWSIFRDFTLTDMPNGYFLIKCSSEEMVTNLLLEGPWTVNGMVLHLIPWKENFQPVFERLTTVVLWIQLHHLPTECWTMDNLETVASFFGTVVKIDEKVETDHRTKYARVCIEIDVEQPLKKGVWVKKPYSSSSTFVAAVYDRLPVFCYKCGIIDHSAGTCQLGQNGSRRTDAGTGLMDLDPKGKGA
ncbi:hypothetical protein J5N97_008355 [Dioscorea zingiberensis]|uniref:DUF4283 domain-containing protein n=1 Tax=Dioscorea zingiberensis TaxID=325984 RepID=A0A9D5HKL6_9LILI|nr:hypothetical protein J5N97_008355 [Dioscorea zingiberensis]